ncbi:YicC/YloC family endoribonuclease [Enterococcus camelliae]|uniref:YicC/YloC family endoribonuclease n=1 Tax=Enterococcus camelliae TaxID=453959 RepID=A0ABW5TLC8_9ENTE
MRSMTGFGKAQAQTNQVTIDIEIKTVNQRFLDIQFRMPRILNEAEHRLRNATKNHLARGRVDVFITVTERAQHAKEVMIDWETITAIVEEAEQESERRFGVPIAKQALVQSLIMQDQFFVLHEQPIEEDQFLPVVLATFDEALLAVAASRQQEGLLLKKIMQEQKAALASTLEQLRGFYQTYEQEYQERLTKKIIERLDQEADEARLLTEIALLIERGDIHEELDRLTVHLLKLDQLLAKTEPVGRELDFLIQEMNREVNTIGSKSAVIEIKNEVVQLKTILEKMREQVQNVE